MTDHGEQLDTTLGGRISAAIANLRKGFAELNWMIVLLAGVAAGIIMPLVLTGGSTLQFLAGVVPVGAGLLIGRRVKEHHALHGFMVGLISSVLGLVVLYIVMFYTPIGQQVAATALEQGITPELATPQAQFAQLSWFLPFALLIFCTFGASMSGRAEMRNRQVREVQAARGGQLERPPTVREASDIRGMSLAQFGSYVNGIWKKQGFTLKDYRFLKDEKHLDLFMERENEPWHLRLTIVDKVSPGTVESLYQEMKREGTAKGIVLTSTEFLPGTTKAAKDRPIVLIDGPTLYDIAEN